jgi:SAM-dependent methyltransferase
VYAKSAAVYDALYLARGKDYAAEAAAVHALIQQRKRSHGQSLLDVGCGTGGHLAHFARWYDAEGLDLSAEMLAAARDKCSGVPLHRADMTDFDLGRTFDAVVCLFSSIGYVRTAAGLQRAVQTMARHLRPGGVLAVEPWLSPADVGRGGMGLTAADEPGLKVARIFANRVEGRLLVMDWHFLVGTPEGVETFTERHETGLFTPDEYLAAFDAAGIQATYEPDPALERGLYVGVTGS